MPVPIDEATWRPIARKLLCKQDQQQLSLKKVQRAYYLEAAAEKSTRLPHLPTNDAPAGNKKALQERSREV